MKKFNLVLTGLLIGVIIWLLVVLILGVIYQPTYANDVKVTVNFNNKPVEGTETVETTRQVPVTCPFSGETKTSEVKTVVKKTKSEPSERRVVVTEDAFKETMQQVAYTARQEAQNEYDKNFTTLLTILTIFGIAWPIMIALLQFKFNESELNKIRQAEENAQKSIQKADEAYNNSQATLCAIKELASSTQVISTETTKRMGILFETNKIVFGAVAIGNTDLSDYYYVLALRCSTWALQVTKEFGISAETLEDMISNVTLIQPHCWSYNLAESSCQMLIQVREDLRKSIEVSGDNLDLVMRLFALLDEKIAVYKKLLATADNKNK